MGMTSNEQTARLFSKALPRVTHTLTSRCPHPCAHTFTPYPSLEQLFQGALWVTGMALLIEQRLLNKGEQPEGIFGNTLQGVDGRETPFSFTEGKRTSLIMKLQRMGREDSDSNRLTLLQSTGWWVAVGGLCPGECECVSLFLALLLFKPSQAKPMHPICFTGTQRLWVPSAMCVTKVRMGTGVF